ncbi:hypothetical protein ACCO45_008063 [Purpureocillium lilacinum]|uniref:Uncharacterized protein n=1 Tax=Purpureocillium lilacinum TaxID=33203 RepID=A0ACC4DQB8_PURLI
MMKLWTEDELDPQLLEKEIHLLIEQTNETRLEMNDIIQDRDTISSLCLLYTSMKWLAAKISDLRHITMHETDSSRQALPRQANRRWTLLNDPNKLSSDEGPVHLPLTQETVQTFDKIVTSYEELAGTALLTLHMEILSLNLELVMFDETIVRFLRDKEIAFIRTGLGLLINCYLVTNARMASPMNGKGCGRMQLNILVLQQNLKNIEEGAKEDKEKGQDGVSESNRFSYDELKALVELCFSEQMANPERGIATAAKRRMDDKLLGLSEHMWQT